MRVRERERETDSERSREQVSGKGLEGNSKPGRRAAHTPGRTSPRHLPDSGMRRRLHTPGVESHPRFGVSAPPGGRPSLLTPL